MDPIKFKEVNTVFAENQPEYIPLPAHHCKDKYGTIIFCMKGSFKERLIFLITGKMWVRMLTFNDPLTPSMHSVYKHDMFLTLKKFAFEKISHGFWFRIFGYGWVVMDYKIVKKLYPDDIPLAP